MKIVFVYIFFLVIGCTPHFILKNDKKIKKKTYHLTMEAPGTVRLPNNLMVDETEITNFSWMEYVYWAKRIFGEDSVARMGIFPDTNVWKKTDSCLYPYSKYYLTHPAYRNCPVVGITKEQALIFCKWRSDRVFEYMLVRSKAIEWNPLQNDTSYFTIERYFAGKYFDHVPDTHFKYVPVYDLPSVAEWNYILNYHDSLEYAVFAKSRKHAMRQNWLTPFLNADMPSCGIRLGTHATVSVKACNFSQKIDGYIYNLRGNVSEMTIEENSCMGGSWNDSRKIIFANPVFVYKSPNAYTGFRCVCTWKKVDEYIKDLNK